MLGADQIAHHGHGARGVEDVHDRLRIARRNFHGGVGLAGRGAADEQRQFQAFAFHLAGAGRHFVERRRDPPAQADDVLLQLAGGLQNFLARHHHAEVNDLVVVATEHDADNVFADVMHVALDGGHEDFAGVFVHTAGGFLLRLHERQQIRHGFFHHAGGFHHLGQKHFAGAEQVPDDVHSRHERAFDDEQRPAIFLARFFNIRFDEINDAFHERVAEAFLDRAFAPFIFDDFGIAFLLHRLSEFDQAFGGVGPAVEQHVFDEFEQVFGNLLVNGKHSRIDDAHVEAGLDRVVEKRGVHRLTHDIVATEAEADVTDAAADPGEGEIFLDPFRRADEVHGIIRMLFHAGADGEHVRIKDDVLRREADRPGEQIVGALADRDAALEGVGLAALVKSHDDDGGAMAANQFCLVKKLLFAFFKADRIDDALALQTFQPGFDDFPLRGVHHDGHFANVRLTGDEVEEARHRRDTVNHSFVHADINGLRAVLDLLAGDVERLLEITGLNELGEFWRAGYIVALANVQKIDGRVR